METIKTKTKRWGSSIGVIIPKNVVKKEGIKENQNVEIIIRKPSAVRMSKIFGSLKDWKKPTDKILKEVDKELWNE